MFNVSSFNRNEYEKFTCYDKPLLTKTKL